MSGAPVDSFEALQNMIQGWLSHLGPVTAQELADIFAVPLADIDFCLLKIEASGAVLRGQFRPQAREDKTVEWCDRRLLARIHKLTIATLRKDIQAVSPAQYMNWLTQWQHVAAGSMLAGDERGTLEVLRQLQGFEIPANAWESQS